MSPRHRNHLIGAERFASLFQDRLETIVAQRRRKWGGSIAESVRYETGAAGSLTRMTYKQTAESGEAEVQATIEGAVLSLSGYTLDGAEVSQTIEVAGTVVVCDLLACLSPVIAALDDLAVGESGELDVHVLETFGALRFEPETWILTRAEDAENARVYEGVSKRRSEESYASSWTAVA